MNGFICPVCGKPFENKSNCMVCADNHSFDIAKSGYVNLLMSQKRSTSHHGDDKLMVRCRTAFLQKGYYNPLKKVICERVLLYTPQNGTILDAGCGECYYTDAVCSTLDGSGKNAKIIAVDISRDAVAFGAKRNKNINIAVASIYNMPVADNSCDVLISIFSPFCVDEFLRVLKKGGVIIMAIPLENHLLALKQAVYDKSYKNEVKPFTLDGFELIDKIDIKNTIHLESCDDIKNLFTMTPYYYKTSAADQQKLDKLNTLDVQTEFAVLTYRKI